MTPTHSAPAHPPSIPSSALRSHVGRALVVDDDPFLRRALVAQVAAEGLDCDETADSGRAIELLCSQSYEVVLLDVDLGWRSGLEVLHEVRRRGGLEAPVIFVTSCEHCSSDAVAALEAGAQDFVIRPYDPSVLRARIAAVRRRSRRLREAHTRRQSAERRASVALEELTAHAEVKRACLLPMPTRVGSVVVNAATLSSSAAPGDVAHALRDARGRTVTMLFDAAGHGAAAATVAAIALEVVVDVFRHDGDFERAYHAVTEALLSRELGRAVALGFVRVHDGVLEVFNAGLPPVAIVDAGGTSFIESHAPPAGLAFPEVSSRVRRVQVQPGYAVAFATDGALHGEQDREAMAALLARFRFVSFSRHIASSPAWRLAGLLTEHLGAASERIEDDATLVVMADASREEEAP